MARPKRSELLTPKVVVRLVLVVVVMPLLQTGLSLAFLISMTYGVFANRASRRRSPENTNEKDAAISGLGNG